MMTTTASALFSSFLVVGFSINLLCHACPTIAHNLLLAFSFPGQDREASRGLH